MTRLRWRPSQLPAFAGLIAGALVGWWIGGRLGVDRLVVAEWGALVGFLLGTTADD